MRKLSIDMMDSINEDYYRMMMEEHISKHPDYLTDCIEDSMAEAHTELIEFGVLPHGRGYNPFAS